MASNFSARRLDEMPRVVDPHVHLRIADDVEVVLAEVGGDDARHERLDLGDRLVRRRRIDRHRAGGHARAAADDQHLLRLRRQQRRQVAEHALQPHVLRLARRLHLAGVVVVAHAVGQLRDRDRRVQPFADVDDVRLPDARRRVAAVRDEQARQLVDAARQQAGRDHARRRAPRCRRCSSALRPAVASARAAVPPAYDGSSISSADSADTMMITCSVCELPIHGIRTKLVHERADDRADGVGGVDAAGTAAPRPARSTRPPRAPAESSRPRGSRPAAPPRGSAPDRAAA